MQDRGDAEQPAEAAGIAAEREQGAGGGNEEDLEEALAVVEGERLELLGDSEDDVEVVGGQHAFHPLGDPAGLAQALTLGAVPVAARVVGDLAVPAGVAHVEVPAQDRGPAGLDVMHDPAREVAEGMPMTIGLAVRAKDVRDLEARPPLRPVASSASISAAKTFGGSGSLSRVGDAVAVDALDGRLAARWPSA